MLVINNALMCDVSTVCRLFLIDGRKLGSCTYNNSLLRCFLLLLLCVCNVYMRAFTFALALSIAPTHQDKDWSATVQPLEPCAN